MSTVLLKRKSTTTTAIVPSRAERRSAGLKRLETIAKLHGAATSFVSRAATVIPQQDMDNAIAPAYRSLGATEETATPSQASQAALTAAVMCIKNSETAQSLFGEVEKLVNDITDCRTLLSEERQTELKKPKYNEIEDHVEIVQGMAKRAQENLGIMLSWVDADKPYNDACGICFEENHASEDIETTTTPCNHKFCTECIDEWKVVCRRMFGNCYKCPYCQAMHLEPVAREQMDLSDPDDPDDRPRYRSPYLENQHLHPQYPEPVDEHNMPLYRPALGNEFDGQDVPMPLYRNLAHIDPLDEPLAHVPPQFRSLAS